MNETNIRRLLSIASGFHPANSPRSRADRAAKVRAWQLALENAGITDTDLEAAEHAVIDYYTENTDTIMPAHIVSRVRSDATTVSGVLSQDPPCLRCGLQPGHRAHRQHHDYEMPALGAAAPGELILPELRQP